MSNRILGIAGSTRQDSLNRRLVHVALSGAESTGAEIEHLDLRELEIPLYDEIEEGNHGMPDGVRRLRETLKRSHGIVIASPEYNGSMTAVLKNAIDWTTRPDPESPEDPPLVAWRGKVAGLLSTSPGGLGGIRGLVHIRAVLSHVGSHVVPQEAAIPFGHGAFHDDGSILDEKRHALVESVGHAVATLAARLPRD
ncbi:MAG TPA: NADPH-dependent FMN reductase [Phycisphaerales bacterium]|mgnify:FL=1|nr:NADPH-dependent FMN reductase [Phycisphaerales bacterium]